MVVPSSCGTLAGPNEFTGNLPISEGTVIVTSSAGLGTTVGLCAVSANATLDLRNVTVGENLTLSGTAASGANLAASSGISTVSGTVTLAALTNAIEVAGSQLTLSGVISGSGGGFSKTGGTLILSVTNTYTGTTAVKTVTLVLANVRALGSTSNNAGAVTVDSGATTVMIPS